MTALALPVWAFALAHLWVTRRSSRARPVALAVLCFAVSATVGPLWWLAGLAGVGCMVWFGLRHPRSVLLVPLWLGCLGLLGGNEVVARLSFLLAALSAVVHAAFNLVRWARRARGYRLLGPVWTELVAAVPSVVLGDPPRWFAGPLELRLYRRAVEIRDAQLEVSGRVSPDVRAFAGTALAEAGVTSALALDACVLRIGLALPDAAHPAETSAWSGSSSLDDELADLLALRRELRDPAVLAAARRSLTPR
ncbi:DUF6545 domain-containing protein [Lentzea sp. CA-135723]|uniref:DUF6545 domain-containing protein n=1 Tax=Lentzea sp. CA-135723 TaxID=3239950 RepID=UPI003D90A51D